MICSVKNTLFLLPLTALALAAPTNGNVDARDVQGPEIDAAIAEQIVDAVSGMQARSDFARSDVVGFVNEALRKRDVIVARAGKDKTLKKKPKEENLRNPGAPAAPAPPARPPAPGPDSKGNKPPGPPPKKGSPGPQANMPPKQDDSKPKTPQSNNPNPGNASPGNQQSRWSPDSSNSGKGSKWDKVKQHFIGGKKKKN